MMDVAARFSTSVAFLLILFFASAQGAMLCLKDGDCASITSSSCVITTGCIKGYCTCSSGKTLSADGLSCVTTTTTTTTTVATTTSTTASTASTTTTATTTTTPTTTTTATTTTTTHAATTTTTTAGSTTTTTPTTTTVSVPTRLNRGLGAQCTNPDDYGTAPYLLECADNENLKCDVCPENYGFDIFTCVSTGSGDDNGGSGSSALSAAMATVVMVTLAGLVL